MGNMSISLPFSCPEFILMLKIDPMKFEAIYTRYLNSVDKKKSPLSPMQLFANKRLRIIF